jgi:hypothetical protein
MKIKPSTAIIVLIVLLVSSFLLMRELSWRFEPSLDISQTFQLRDKNASYRLIHIRQQSDSPVDIERHMYQDMTKGVTYITMWLDGKTDTTRFTIKGRYYSEIRSLTIAIDSTTQAFLVPNTEHGMPNGWGELIYITPSDTIGHFQVIMIRTGDLRSMTRM